MKRYVCIQLLLLIATAASFGQSSSLYVTGPTIRQEIGEADIYDPNGRVSRLSPAIARNSLVAVPLPAPRSFSEQDLVTVIIREETQAQWDAGLATAKDVNWDAQLEAFPDLQQLLEFTLAPGVSEAIAVDLNVSNEFDGEGDLARKEVMTGRVQARVIDIKPNGTLVLEARKFNQIDDETLTIVLTGVCRAQDITVDNTILSSELYDLNLVKSHTGELRRATKKGLITRLLDLLLNF